MIRIKDNIEKIQPYVPGVLKAGAIKLASNENPLGPSPKALVAVKKYLKNANLYPDSDCRGLREKLAAKYSLQPDNFIIGNGSDELFLLIAALLIEPGVQMLTSVVTFSEYEFAARIFGGEPVFAPMKEGKYQLDQILSRINEKTKLIFLANPNNPTGTYFTDIEFKTFLQGVPQDILVVCDEAYGEYVSAKDYPDSLALLKAYPNLLITRTFSKIYGLAGLRVGYGIGATELIAAMHKVRAPFNVNVLAQQAAEAALQDDAFIKNSVKNNEKGKKYLYQEFTRLKLKFYPTVSNFIFVYLPLDCLTAFQKLMDLGVTVRPMKTFGVNNAIRVTIGTMVQNKFFIKCLKKIL